MDHFVVHRDAGVGRITATAMLVAVTGALSSKPGDPIAAGFFQVLRRDAGSHERLELIQHSRGDCARLAIFGDSARCFDRDSLLRITAGALAPTVEDSTASSGRRPSVR